MRNFLGEFRKYIAPGRYLLAVSGGVDSIALADIAGQVMQENPKYEFVVAHVEHGIRGEESLRDARFVEEFCRQRRLQFCLEHVDVPARAQMLGQSIEQAARDLRYQVLFRLAQKVMAKRIITAHHANDQAETMLLRLVRGSGLRGLGAMHRDNGMVVRPLLSCTHEELVNYCRSRDLKWVDDSSNDDIEYTRNFIRRQLVPLLERINPSCVTILCQTAMLLQEDEQILSDLAKESALKRIRGTEMNTANWSLLAPAVRKRIIRSWLYQLGCEPTAVHTEAVDRLIITGTSQKSLALPGVTVKYAYHKVYAEQDVQHARH